MVDLINQVQSPILNDIIERFCRTRAFDQMKLCRVVYEILDQILHIHQDQVD